MFKVVGSECFVQSCIYRVLSLAAINGMKEDGEGGGCRGEIDGGSAEC